MEHDAERALRSIHRFRSGDRFPGACRKRHGRHLPREQQELSTARRLCLDALRRGKTVLRGAYGIYVDQPMTSLVTATSGNPPLAVPLTFTGTVRLDNALSVAGPTGLAPQTVDHDFENAYVQSWNLNLQHRV